MEQHSVGPRNSCKVIVINDRNELLTIKKKDEKEIYHVLPGGGQHHGETFIETVRRECKEELGIEPKIEEEIVFIREYIGKNHEFPSHHEHVHQIEFMFRGELGEGSLGHGVEEDAGQIGIEWIKIEELERKNFYPKELIPALAQYAMGRKCKIYMGDIN